LYGKKPYEIQYMKKILILGSTGMLGHILYQYLKKCGSYHLIDVSHQSKLTENSILIDATDRLALEKLIFTYKPNILINCIGVLINGSQKDPANSIYLNAYLPHYLSQTLRKIEGKLIHISTDCVFSGSKGQYSEFDVPDAIDIYGRSKALGEVFNEIDLTLRTSIIGPEIKSNGEGLFHWFMSSTGTIAGYTNSFWDGVTTLELSKAIEYSIRAGSYGLAHVTNGKQISKYDLLIMISKYFNKSITIVSDPLKVSNKTLQISTNLNFEVSSYNAMLSDLSVFMLAHKEMYDQYL